MQVSDMRALRILYSHEHHLLPLSSRKSSSCPSFIFSKFPESSKFSRQLHSSLFRPSPLESTQAATNYSAEGSNSWSGSSLSTSKKDAPVETFYDPISGCIRTKRDYKRNAKDREAELNTENQINGDNNLSISEQVDAVGTRVYGEEIGSRRGKGKGKGKSKTAWVCSNCGYSDGQWWGYCKSCNASGSMKQFSLAADNGKVTGFEVSENLVRSWLPNKSADVVPIRLTDVKRGLNSLSWRIPL